MKSCQPYANTVDPALSSCTLPPAGGLSVSVRQLLGYYVALEEVYMEACADTAIRIDEAAAGSLTSSAVDDVFYVLRKCATRALACGNVQVGRLMLVSKARFVACWQYA